jgi:UDP-hydrolysing UDP-N-acetyl-D-glucosamine 2-epimerase
LSGRIVAHVHGGDRAAGQVDDSLRHAITKLAHVHFPATPTSAERLIRLGENAWRIHTVGSPGIDGIARDAAGQAELAAVIGPLSQRPFALLVLHPVDVDPAIEYARAMRVARETGSVPFAQIVIIHPNNDPGSAGIVRAWNGIGRNPRFIIRPDVPRNIFLGLLRDAAVLVGNSSSGIIEAASFGTPVVDIGPRQLGRECGENVIHVGYDGRGLRGALDGIWNKGAPRRATSPNPYGGAGTGRKIASVLARLQPTERVLRKLIAY